MAPTYTPQAALNLVQFFAHGIPVTTPGPTLCDIVHSMIWRFYPWRWTIGSITPIACSNGVQDYTPTNTDILRPLKLRIVRTDITPNEFRELELTANLAPELTRQGGLETETKIGWYPSTNIFRLLYPTQVVAPQVLQIQGEYQKIPPLITSGAPMSTPFLFPDHFFNVFVEGLKWKIYQLSDDPRAGTTQFTKNGSMVRAFSGQLGVFMEQLLQMSRDEDLGQGDEFMFPADSLGVGRSYWPGLYGL